MTTSIAPRRSKVTLHTMGESDLRWASNSAGNLDRLSHSMGDEATDREHHGQADVHSTLGAREELQRNLGEQEHQRQDQGCSQ